MRSLAQSAPASREIRRVCPSSDKLRVVHSGRRCRLRRSGITCQVPDSFRPRGFSPPRRVPPHTKFRACCIPVPEGVRSVSRLCLPLVARRPESRWLASGENTASSLRLHTLRRSPPADSRIASLRPLPPRRCASGSKTLAETRDLYPATLDLEALLRLAGPCSESPVAVRFRALSFLGLRSPTGFLAGPTVPASASPLSKARPNAVGPNTSLPTCPNRSLRRSA